MAKSKKDVVPTTTTVTETPKVDVTAFVSEESTKPLLGRKVSPTGGNKSGKCRLRNTITNAIITGFIPFHLAEMQIKNNKNLEIINE